ncbi:MAG: hypothetical protein K2P51_00425 [Rhabdochlamydiaceae bacterium]|nr:hypothetical protein [Rhabdochlamydiaceae bacterium]
MEYASQESPARVEKSRNPYFFAAVGPSFLALALCALLIWIAPFMTPFVLLAGGGWLLIGLAKTKGLIFSLLALVAVAVWQFSFLMSHLWCSLFIGAMGVSWLILWMGQKEVYERESSHSQLINELEAQKEQAMSLEKMMQAHLESLQNETEGKLKEMACSLERALQEVKTTQGCVEAKEHESELWMRRCESLTHELSSFQEREKILEAELLKSQGPANPIISQESHDESLQMQYWQLQEQFQEKSDLLHQTRKELFQKEGELILFQKDREEEIASLCEQDRAFHAHLDGLADECKELGQEIVRLEEIISTLVLFPENSCQFSDELFDVSKQEAPLQALKKPRAARKTSSKKKGTVSNLLQDVKEKSQQISLLD